MSALIEVEFFDHHGSLIQEYFIPAHQICAIRKSDNGCWVHVVGMVANNKLMPLRSKLPLEDLKDLLSTI